MSSILRNGRLAGRLALALAAATAAQGCVPYTSNYKPDPARTTVATVVDPAAAGPWVPSLRVAGLPTEAAPDGTVRLRAVRSRTGPAVEKTRLLEQRYKNYWSAAAIPLGLVGVALAPVFILVAPIIGAGPDTPDKMTVFGGWSRAGCEPRGLLLGYLIFSVGHVPTCEAVGEPRITESSKPLGRDAAEETPLAGAALRVALAPPGGKPAGGIRLETDASGHASTPLTPLLLDLPDDVEAPEVVASIEADPAVAARAPLSPGAVRALAGPVREERAGDRAAAEGKGLVALDHYARAAGMRRTPAENRGLRGKIAATYRSLPVKPPPSEETRRLLVQAESLARANDAAGAIAKLSEAVRTAPWLPVARYNLAMAHAMNNDYAAAIASMNDYLELAPDAPDARQARDKVYEWEALAPAPAPSAGESGGARPGPTGGGRRR